MSDLPVFRVGVATPEGMTAAYSYFVPALALGFDRDAGLRIELFYGGTPDQTAEALARGECDVACLNAIVGIIARDEGKPFVALGSKARRAHRWFAVPPGDRARSLQDLKGRRISCEYPHLAKLGDAALVEEGISPSEIEWLPWRGSDMEAGPMAEALRAGQVDAVFTIDWNDGDFEAHGLKLRHLPSKLLDRLKLSSCYWTVAPTLERRHDLFGPALHALTRSIHYASENIADTIEMSWDRYPHLRPAPDSRKAAGQRHRSILKACLAPMLVEPGDKDQRLGTIDESDVAFTRDYMLRSGWIRRCMPVADCYTRAFEPFFNQPLDLFPDTRPGASH